MNAEQLHPDDMELKTALQYMTDKWIEEGNYSDYTVMRLVYEVKRLHLVEERFKVMEKRLQDFAQKMHIGTPGKDIEPAIIAFAEATKKINILLTERNLRELQGYYSCDCGEMFPDSRYCTIHGERKYTLLEGFPTPRAADGAWDCPNCKKPNIAVASKCWFCESPHR
jgi:hypothetical protein